MNRRDFIRSMTAAGSLAGGLSAASLRRPNIILIMADDMGFSDLGCYGGEIPTPNLNQLARQGIRFTQFYNTARCCPTRASLLTGLYPHQTGVGHMVDTGRPLPGYTGDLNRNCVTIAQLLHGAGYRTAMSGKWHVTPVSDSKHNWPLQRGFEKFFGTIHGGGSYYDPVTLTRGNAPIQPERNDFYYTTAIAENAVSYIQDFCTGPDPFFLYVAFTSPHWPLHAPTARIDEHRKRYQAGWDVLRQERHARMIEMGIVDRRWPLTPRDPRVPAWEDAPNKDWHSLRMAVYAAQIQIMDESIGRILSTLHEKGIEDDTLVLFLADNGGCAEELGTNMKALHVPLRTRSGLPVRPGNDPSIMPGPDDTYQSYGVGWANASNTPFRLYKHWVHEGGIATPLIARWPRAAAEPGTLTNQPDHLIDIMATCLDLASARYPTSFEGAAITPLEGRSLRPVLEGRRRALHSALFWEHEGNRAIRQGDWKLVSRHPDRWELYHLGDDRTEMRNLGARFPHKAEDLMNRYFTWARRANVVPWEQFLKTPRA